MPRSVFILTEFNEPEDSSGIIGVYSNLLLAEDAKAERERVAAPGDFYFIDEFDLLGDDEE